MIHLYILGRLPPKDVSYLRGYLSFVTSVEPEFVAALHGKYGRETIVEVMQSELVQRK